LKGLDSQERQEIHAIMRWDAGVKSGMRYGAKIATLSLSKCVPETMFISTYTSQACV